MVRIAAPSSWWIAGSGALLAVLVVITPALGPAALVVALLAYLAAVAAALRTAIVDGHVAVVMAAVGACTAGTAWLGDARGSAWVEVVVALVAASGITSGLHRWYRLRHEQVDGDDADGVLGDAAVVALGTWIVSWAVWARHAGAPGSGHGIDVAAGLHLPIAAIGLFLFVLVVLRARRFRPAAVLLGSGALVALLSTGLVAIAAAGHLGHVTPVSRALAVLGLALTAGAVTHPSAASLGAPQAVSSRQRAFGRLVITTASLVAPLVVLAVSRADGRVDQIVRTVAAAVLALAVTWRVLRTVHVTRTAHDRLLHTAQTDPLTGLPNRTLLLERLEDALRASWHGPIRPTLYFVDLDRFKNINDSLGHAAGDQVLCTVAERLLLAVPERAMVARLSGDEYVVLDTATVEEMSFSLGERLLSVFREPLPLAQGDVFVTASVGIATIDANTRTSAEDLLRHADTAMYRAKDAGRNCVVFYDESMHERVAHRLAVETALYRALDRRELRLYHQPILDLHTGEVVGFEALMRWQQHDGMIVSPAEFIPIAEDTGTIIPIGSWALLEALSQLRRWIDDRVCSPSATMSVNVSPRQLADPAFPSIVSEALLRSGVAPSSVWLEITESVMMTEPDIALATLEKLKALGVLIALDDFGTGFSSLSLLQRFPLQRIKIDRAFVQGVADRASDRSLVRTIIAMGSSLGLDLVAEGVESVHQMQVLRDLGCHKAQGYLISHPVPADAMRSTVAALERLSGSPLLRGNRDTQSR